MSREKKPKNRPVCKYVYKPSIIMKQNNNKTKAWSKESCCKIKANKFHHIADTIKTQKANEVETQRIEFKGLITTIKGAPKQTKPITLQGNFGGNQEINNIPTL